MRGLRYTQSSFPPTARAMEYLLALATGHTIVNPPEWLVAGYLGAIVGLVKLTGDAITGALIDRTNGTKDKGKEQ